MLVVWPLKGYFADMAMKIICPNQGRCGFHFDVENVIDYDGKNL
jgi:hypothetical protein